MTAHNDLLDRVSLCRIAMLMSTRIVHMCYHSTCHSDIFRDGKSGDEKLRDGLVLDSVSWRYTQPLDCTVVEQAGVFQRAIVSVFMLLFLCEIIQAVASSDDT